MDMDDYSIFFLVNVDSNFVFFLENFLGNEVANMVSPVIVFLHSAHPCHSCFLKDNGILYLLCLVFYTILF
jgi:hypothetical protein